MKRIISIILIIVLATSKMGTVPVFAEGQSPAKTGQSPFSTGDNSALRPAATANELMTYSDTGGINNDLKQAKDFLTRNEYKAAFKIIVDILEENSSPTFLRAIEE